MFSAKNPVLLLSLLALALLGCREQASHESVMVRDSSGVTLVSNPGSDEPLSWRWEEVLEIPPAEEGDDGFFEATDVTVTDDGSIAVMDRMGKKVVLFDTEGELLRQYGREGSGPGEFQYPLVITPIPEGGVAVFDMMNRRLERFDSLLEPTSPQAFQVPYFGGPLAYVGDFLVLTLSEQGGGDSEAQSITAIREGDTIEVVRYQREVGGPVQLESCGIGLSGIPPLFSPVTRWSAGPGGNLFVMGTAEYEVEVYRAPDFRLERRIRRSVPAIQANPELAGMEVGEGMRIMTPAGERVCDPKEVVEKRGFAPVVPPISRVAVSPSGEIFLQRRAPGEEELAVDVLDSEGVYQGTLPPGFPFPRGFLGPDRMVVTEEDDLGLTSVVVYRIIR